MIIEVYYPMKKLFCIITMLFSIININPMNDEIINNFDHANLLYSKKDFSNALKIYKDLLDNGYDNFQINYNIGCCYFEQKKIGEARYYFERSLYYRPFENDVFFNLNIIYNKIDNPHVGEHTIMTRRIIYFIPMKIVIVLIIIFQFLTIVFLVLTYLINTKRKYFFILFTITLIFTLFFTFTFFIQYKIYNIKYFVTTAEKSNLYVIPDDTETLLTSVNIGTSGIIIEEVDDYIRIKLKDGITGWLEKNKVIYKP